MEKECKFCRAYEAVKQFNNRTTDDEYDKHFKTKYFAQFVTKDWDTVNKQYVGRMGREMVALKYCPLCGKKLER